MSFSKEVVLWCDGCTHWIRFNTRIVQSARKSAKKYGWSLSRGGQDYCADCTSDRKFKA